MLAAGDSRRVPLSQRVGQAASEIWTGRAQENDSNKARCFPDVGAEDNMGCSGSKEYKLKLDQVGETCKQNPTGIEADGLDTMAEAARALVAVMDEIAKGGGRDTESMTRIERLSEEILTNLESRVTVDLLVSPNCEAVREQLMAIAKDLNQVRANKATDIIDLKFKELGGRAVQAEVQNCQALLAEIKEPVTLIPVANRIAEAMNDVMAKAVKDDKRVANALLKVTDALGKATAALFPKLMVDDLGNVAAMKEVAAKVDEIVPGLAKTAGTAQEPLGEKVDQLCLMAAKRQADAMLLAARNALANTPQSPPKAMAALKALLPWFPYAKEADGVEAKLAAVLTLVQQSAVEAHKKAVLDDNPEQAKGVLDFAAKIDELRAGFGEGYEVDGGGLHDLLASGESDLAIGKNLNLFEEELAKIEGGGLNLPKMLQPLEALAAQWADVPQDGPHPERLQTGCATLEEWAVKSAATVHVPKMINMLAKFAERYDEVRLQLVPPELPEGPLVPRVSQCVFDGQLRALEEQLGKPVAERSPAPMLAALRLISLAVPKAQREDGENADKLKAAMTGVTDYAAEVFQEALNADAKPKVEGMMQWAVEYDKVATSLAGEDGVESLADSLGKLKAVADCAEANKEFLEKAGTVQAELDKDNGLNPQVILQALTELVDMWPDEGPSEAVKTRVTEIYAILRQRMVEACAKAADSDEPKKIAALMVFAVKYDKVQESLGNLSVGFAGSVACSGATSDIDDVEAELAKTENMDAKIILNSVRQLKLYWPHMGESDEAASIKERLQTVNESVTTRILAKFQEALNENNKKSGQALGGFANDWDRSFKEIEGVDVQPLTPQLQEKAKEFKAAASAG